MSMAIFCWADCAPPCRDRRFESPTVPSDDSHQTPLNSVYTVRILCW